MSRYIDADALEYDTEWSEYHDGFTAYSQMAIDTAPSIDIVFCEDCRDCVEKGTGADCPSGYGYLYCTRKKSVVNEDDYCSWGERR